MGWGGYHNGLSRVFKVRRVWSDNDSSNSNWLSCSTSYQNILWQVWDSIQWHYSYRPKKGGYYLTFNNASQVRGRPLPRPDFIVESSGELLTDKLQVYKDESSEYISPFIKTLTAIDPLEMSTFLNCAMSFLQFCENGWPKIRRIHEIWINEKHEYLAKELRNYLSSLSQNSP